MHTLGVSDEFSELPSTPEHDHLLVNQSDNFLHPSGNNIISAS